MASTTTPTPAIDIDFDALPGLTQALQSVDKRDSAAYRGKILGIGNKLNRLGRGVITSIDIEELREQIGHLLYYRVKDVAYPVPFDIDSLHTLYSHFRNPTVIVLRRIRRYLMASHRKALARLEEEQARERQIDFTNLDLNTRIKSGLEEMQRIQTMASIAGTVTRKLDILTKGLHVPARVGAELRLLDRFFVDPHHLRHGEAMRWIEGSMFQGNRNVLRKMMAKGRGMLDQKSDEIFGQMEKLGNLPRGELPC